MTLFRTLARDSLGNLVPDVLVSVFDAGTTTPRAIFTDPALILPKDNPFISADGIVEFFTAEGELRLQIAGSSLAFDEDFLPVPFIDFLASTIFGRAEKVFDEVLPTGVLHDVPYPSVISSVGGALFSAFPFPFVAPRDAVYGFVHKVRLSVTPSGPGDFFVAVRFPTTGEVLAESWDTASSVISLSRFQLFCTREMLAGETAQPCIFISGPPLTSIIAADSWFTVARLRDF